MLASELPLGESVLFSCNQCNKKHKNISWKTGFDEKYRCDECWESHEKQLLNYIQSRKREDYGF